MSAVEAHEIHAASPAPTRPDRALQGLYERHADRIFGFCRRRLRSHEEAEDAVQTTFLHALRALQRGVVPLSETAWLFKIAENVCLSAHRSNGRRGDLELSDGEELVARAPAREARSDALFGLESALAAIPERQRRVFVLRELRGLSYREIAVQDGVTVAAVETLVFRARRSLARALENGAGLKGRLAGLLDLGAAVSAIKTAFSGAAAAKFAAAAVVVAVATVPAGDAASPPKAGQIARAADRTERAAAPARSASDSSRPGVAVQTRESRSGRSAAHHALTKPSGPPRTGNEPPATAPPGVKAPSPEQQAPAPGAPRLPTPPAVPGTPVLETVLPTSPELPAAPVNLPALPELPVAPVRLPNLNDDLPELPVLP